MTLLTIATAVADETKGPRPETIAGNDDPAAQNILRIINRCGYKLMLTYPWQVLRAEEIVTAPGTETLVSAANMPAGFNRFIPETMWDRDTNNLISGPIKPVEWNGLKVQTFSSENKKFIRRGGAILTAPVIDSGVTVAFEYVSENWADVTAEDTPKVAFTIDTDVARIDEELLIACAAYTWLDLDGQPAATQYQYFMDMLDDLTDAEDGSRDILVAADIFALNSRHHTGAPKASRASYGGDF